MHGIPTELYKAVVESANDAVIVTTPDLDLPGPKVIYVNQAFTRMTGYSYEEIVGNTPRILQGPRTDRNLLNRIRSDLNSKRSFFGEAINYRKDGSEYYVEWRITPVEKDGQIVYWMAIQRDVTARKRIEDSLMEDNQRKDTFLAMLAHELRNPLSPILSSVFLMRNGKDHINDESTLDIIERQVNRMVRLVDDLTDISRIQRGKIALKFERVNLENVAYHAVEMIQPNIKAKGQNLELVVVKPIDGIWADATRLEQVITNLLSNASRYTQEGGNITLKLSQEGGRTIIHVQDNGQGISPDHLLRIFDLFYQEKLTPSAEGGLGIGLTLVKQLVELHQGRVVAHSEGIGKGAMMTVVLPNVEEATGVEGDWQKLPHMMVVDDNPDAANTLASILEQLKIKVKVCYRGAEAIDYYEKHSDQLNVIFLDLGLPDIAGYDVARHIRGDEMHNPLLVAVTGWSQPQDRKQSQQAGFNFHVTKPADIGTIENIVKLSRYN